MQVDDEAAFLATNEQLLLLLEEVDALDHADWHPLLVNDVEVLVEHDELEILGASKVEVELLAVAEALDALDVLRALCVVERQLGDHLQVLRVPGVQSLLVERDERAATVRGDLTYLMFGFRKTSLINDLCPV